MCSQFYGQTILKYNNDVTSMINLLALTILSNIIQYRIAVALFINPPTLTITKQFNGIEFNFASIDIILSTHSFILLSI